MSAARKVLDNRMVFLEPEHVLVKSEDEMDGLSWYAVVVSKLQAAPCTALGGGCMQV